MSVDSQDLNLRLQYWWVNHKLELRRWWVLSLLLLDVLLLFITIIFVLLAVRGSAQLNTRVESQIAALRSPLVVTERPAVLAVEKSWGVRNGDGTTDFVAKISNPNNAWFAKAFTVHFSVGVTAIDETVTGYLLPGETRHVFLHQTGALPPSAIVTGEIADVVWTRPPSLFPVENTSFSVRDATFTQQTIVTGQSIDASRATATVANNSIYGFWAVPVNIILYRGDTPIAISEQTIRQIEPFTEKEVAAQWVQRIPADAQVVVEPFVNPFDETNLLPVE